ncbi:MAG: N-6 DNA methylase [Planctomycetia bacterium]|nr:N-6 DNA methylase [Planctomycetia bacterium]
MSNDAFKDIEKLETDLWEAADNLRANSKLTSSDYFMPVLGVIFLRHAANRFDAAHRQIEADQASGKMPKRKVLPADYIARRSLYLPEKARYDSIMQQAAVSGADLPKLVTEAMTDIEAAFEPLIGVLPKDYGIFETKVLEDLMRLFNSEQIKQATGDVFGRIYEYFLAKFSIQKAHDNGEFFTPSAIVQTIVNVIEPDHGTVFDPACGSGGMFVQSSHFIEHEGGDTAKKVVFYGQEKNRDTIRIAKMNLAVHGLEGKIAEAITYYQDEHNLAGKCDFVMANPPFNVDLVDAERIKGDLRLPFGLPGVNKAKKVGNGNYLWISYFWSYLNDKGRAGFVMSSQASSAGHGEKEVRKKIIETGDVDVMISIRSNFFYTRTVPCELWHFDRNKPASRRDKVLMLDARNIYRKVTRKIYDFSPEQMQNLAAIVWLYRGQKDRYLKLIWDYFVRLGKEAVALRPAMDAYDEAYAACGEPLVEFAEKVRELGLPDAFDVALVEAITEANEAAKGSIADSDALMQGLAKYSKTHASPLPKDNKGLQTARKAFEPDAERMRGLIKQADLLWKLIVREAEAATDIAAKEEAGAVPFDRRALTRTLKAFEEARKALTEQLKAAAYVYRQIVWLQDRFPNAELQSVPGLVKVVDSKEIEAADWSLTPGRYVGVSPQEEDEEFDFEQTLQDIHIELADLNKEAAELAAKIQGNFEELGA